MKLPGQEFLENLAATALRGWLLVGILLRVTQVRDRFDGLVLVYYTTPWPVIAVGFLLLGGHSWRRGKWHPVRRYAVFCLAALFTWVATSWYSTPAATGSPAIRLVHWNVSRPNARVPACAAWLRRQDPDIICLAESRPITHTVIARWQSEFPGYTVQEGFGDMLFLVRGKLLSSERGVFGSDSYFALHRVRLHGRVVAVLQVDLCAVPARSRRQPLARLLEKARAAGDALTFIAGDFNLPRESCHLDPLRTDFVEAFAAAGRGLAETWPVPVLALSLDQVWVARRERLLDCIHGWTWLSDHQPVVVTLAVE